MNRPSMHRTAYRPDAKGEGLPEGLSLLEMMMVVTLILIIASIATPFFRTAVVRAREAVLADHLCSFCALPCHPRADRFPLARE